MHGNFRATTSLIVQGYNNIEYRLCDWCMCLYFTPANYEHIKLLCLSRKDSGKDKIPWAINVRFATFRSTQKWLNRAI